MLLPSFKILPSTTETASCINFNFTDIIPILYLIQDTGKYMHTELITNFCGHSLGQKAPQFCVVVAVYMLLNISLGFYFIQKNLN